MKEMYTLGSVVEMTDRWEAREARARLALGLLLYDVNKDECAAEVLRAGLSYDPGLVEAYVWLGFVYGRLAHYEEMIGAFMAALDLDPQAARAAVGEEPEEVWRIRLILYPLREPSATAEVSWNPAVPADVREACELAEAACAHIGAGRDVEAVEALERSLRLDPVSPHTTSLLALTYLLLGGHAEKWVVGAVESVLWEVSPWLARLLFRHKR